MSYTQMLENVTFAVLNCGCKIPNNPYILGLPSAINTSTLYTCFMRRTRII